MNRTRLTQPRALLAALLAVMALALSPRTAGAAVGLSDSLVMLAAGYYDTEPTVQEILDGLGLSLSAATDNLGWERFCAAKGPVTAGIIGEFSGQADVARLLWYRAGSPLDTLMVLPGNAGAGDSSTFVLAANESVAWCYDIAGTATWFSESTLNSDAAAHVKVYPGGDAQTFLLFWEDLSGLTDADYNDLIIWIRFASPVPALTLGDPAAAGYSLTPNTTICIDLGVESNNCTGDPVTIRMIEGLGTFAPVTGTGSVSAQHCFSAATEGLYTFVFEAALPDGSSDTDTIDIPIYATSGLFSPLGVEVEVNQDNRFTICHPETVCVPFSITSTCELVDIHTQAPAFVDIIGSTICYYAEGGVEFCVPLVAEDGCGRKDTAMVCFIIESSEPTTLNCPAVVETTMCDVGFVSFPVSASGGTPPVSITAVPPAVYNSSTGKVSVLVEETSSFAVEVVVQNAECPPETCVVQVNAQVNTRPSIVGIPDTVIKVCGTGQFCYGPITATDPEDNLSSLRLWGSPGTFSGSTWCFTPTTSTRLVRAVFRAADACGRTRYDTLLVEFNSSPSPVITMNDVWVGVCGPQTVCVEYSIANPAGTPLTLGLLSPGTLNQEDSTICLPIAATGNFTVSLCAYNNCGGGDTATAVIHATLNGPPVLNCVSPNNAIRCSGSTVCVVYSATDPNGGLINYEIHAAGSVINRAAPSGVTDSICIPVTVSGPQTITIIATDGCGAKDTCSTTFPITVNTPPSVALRDTTVFSCQPQQICIPVTCSDIDGNLVNCQAAGSKPGTYSAGQFCFTPDTAGVYTVTGTATDVCGQIAQKTVKVTVVLNRAPVVALSDSTIDTAHDGDTVCVSVNATDADGNLVDVIALDNYLSFDGSQLCLIGIDGEAVCARVVATDACGRKDTAIVCVFAQPNPTPKPDAPDTVFTWFCGEGDICVDFSVGSSECAPVVLSALGDGAINTGDSTLCLAIGAPGYYQTGVVATDDCGAETAFVVIHAVANVAPVIACPQPGADEFLICDDTTICLNVGYADANSNVMGASASFGSLTVMPNSIVNVCLPVDSSGWYSSRVVVFDSCGAADTCDLLVRINRSVPPVISMPDDVLVMLCEPEELCYDLACSDPDSNFLACEQLGASEGSWDGELLCFTPTAEGVYQWVFRATDECGATDIDTFRVTVQFNDPPSIVTQPVVNYELCGPDTICFPIILLDPNGGPLSVWTSLGEVRQNAEVCVYRTTPGQECLTLIVTDSCGLKDTATVCLIGTVTPPPVVDAPDDIQRRICGPGQVCFDVQVTHDKPWIGLVSPIGQFNQSDTSVCFNADTAGIYTLIVSALDNCGAVGADTILVDITFNLPPVITVPANLTRIFCAAGSVCVNGFSATDPDGNLKHFVLLGAGTLDPGAGSICFNADTTGQYCFQLSAQDSCGTAVVRNVCITMVPNQAPAVTITDPGQVLLFEEPTEICLGLVAVDPNTGQKRTLSKISGAGVFPDVISNATIETDHCFIADTTGCYQFVFGATDSCGAYDADTALVCVRIEPPDTIFQICIDDVESINGRNAEVKIRAFQSLPMGGYDFLVCFDPTMLTLSQAYKDSALTGWEYFTYRVGAATGCASCGPGVVRLIGIFDLNNGQGPPPSEKLVPKGPLFRLVFFVTPDRLFINQCAPIRFCFEDCGDNTISSPTGDTLYMALSGVDPACLEGTEKGIPIPKIQYCDGSLCIIPPPDDRGDINLNGIANEIADAVLLSNYFIYGPSVWDPTYYESQILATDVNCDGLVLTIADLVYLIRVITHDAEPINCPDGSGKIAPIMQAARLTFERKPGVLEAWIESGSDLGGVFVQLAATDGTLGALEWDKNLGGLTPYVNKTKDGIRTLLVAKQIGAKLPVGRHRLFSIPYDGSNNWDVIEAQAASASGDVLQLETVTTGSGLPTSFELEQNHPNPFNAGTQIRFRLGQPSEWELTIYNVLGQAVRRFDGADDAGYVTINWDARTDDGKNLASGVYFTRFKAGEFTASKKMVLLK